MKKVIILLSISIIFGFIMTGCGKTDEVLVSFPSENEVDTEAVGELISVCYNPGYSDMDLVYHNEILEKNADGDWVKVIEDQRSYDEPATIVTYAVSDEDIERFVEFIKEKKVLKLVNRKEYDDDFMAYEPWEYIMEFDNPSIGNGSYKVYDIWQYKKYSDSDLELIKELGEQFDSLNGEIISDSSADVQEDDNEDEVKEDEYEYGYISDGAYDTLDEKSEYKAVYEPVISEIVEVLLDGYVDGREYKYVPKCFFEIAEARDYAYLPPEIGFVITDINGDGVKELIIGEDYPYDDVRLQTSIYCIFTKREDKAFAVLGDGDGCDIRYKWLGNGKLLYMEQISETEEAFGDFRLSEDGTLIEWDDFYFSYSEDNGETGFYHNNSGKCNIRKSEEIEMTRDEFFAMRDNYESQCKMLRLIPIQNYKYGSIYNRGDEVEVDDVDSIIKELPGNWLFPNEASLNIGYNDEWYVTDSKNWYHSGKFETESKYGIVRIELYSDLNDGENERVAQGILHYDNTGHPVINIEFIDGFSKYTNGEMTLQKSPDLVF